MLLCSWLENRLWKYRLQSRQHETSKERNGDIQMAMAIMGKITHSAYCRRVAWYLLTVYYYWTYIAESRLLIDNLMTLYIIIIYSYTMYGGTCIRELTRGLVTLPS